MSGKRYTDEFKIAAVKQVTERGHTAHYVADRLGVSIHSIDRAEPLAAAIRCSGAKPGVGYRHYLHSDLRRMALPGCGA